MIIFSWIMLVGLVGLLWAMVLSLIHTDGRDHNRRNARNTQNRTAESHSERAAQRHSTFYTVFIPRLVE
jgi:hypothetical protein